MKTLENVLKILVRLINLPLFVIQIVLTVSYCTILLFIVTPIEFLIVMPVYYLITGKWYYDEYGIQYPYGKWFPICYNMENHVGLLPVLVIDEDIIDLSRYYDRDKEHEGV